MPENPEPKQPDEAKPKNENASASGKTKRRPFGSVMFWTWAISLLLLWGVGWYYNVCGRWIHLLPALALLSAIVDFLTRGLRGDIAPESGAAPEWDSKNPLTSLANIRAYVINEAAKSINWYWRAKRSKARPSYVIRFLAWILAGVAGLLPIIGGLISSDNLHPSVLSKPLWPSLLLGIAAALFGLDKTFGYSSGWARYVLTATNIRKILEEFRMDWARLIAKAGSTPKDEDVAALIDRASRFRTDVENLVLQETKEWVTEFQANTAQTEKEIAAQLAALKDQVDKTSKPKEAPAGKIEVTVTNADQAEGPVHVKLIGPVTLESDIPAGSKVFKQDKVPPGSYKLTISAKMGGKDASGETQVTIKDGETATPQLSLTAKP